ncbi:MAG: roadblock/LC7 domain-containing protein [Candidatus Lokiarchaeota archaeon]|nr:roadblock/LC7 domain-containing protein [Candidatus Lokiarchaeota archaeon]
MVSRLELVLKELNENGNFRASLFSTATGLVLASQKLDDTDEKAIAAMSSLLSDAADKAREELNLSTLDTVKIKFREDLIIMRNIIIPEGDTNFILAILAKVPDSDDVEHYYDQLLDWAIKNCKEDLIKIISI